MFNYEIEIGGYSEDTRLKIDLRVKHGVSKDDYEKLRDHFNGVEKVLQKYRQDIPKEPSDSDTRYAM